MSFEKNTYYKLESIGSEAVVAAEMLLKQYPITRMFLDILGRYLMNQIQFGIFAPRAEIIVQGAKGKDLFLICNHQADVIVNTKQILQLQAPVMVGDKGIIDRESIRNATIAISPGVDSLVVQIPLELFIRSFKKQNIKDSEFTQERKIYYHLFLEVQERLFKYSQIQKNLWEEINTSLHSLNIQLIAGSLNQQEEKEWDPESWTEIMRFLHAAFGLRWPDNLPRNVSNLVDILKKVLDKKLPRSGFKGTDQQYAFKKQMVWKAWLNTLSGQLVKVIPADKLPISIGEIELFNPRIYQMRVSNLLQSIERKFMLTKVKPKDGDVNKDALKAARFFGRKVKKHEFNLDAYTKAINDQFAFKNPNRIMAQVTQQIAQLTATCENEFNASVSKMQHFLEKIKSLSLFENETHETSKADEKTIESCLTIIKQGFKAYYKRIMGRAQVHVGEIRFNKTGSPVIRELINSWGTDHTRQRLDEANQTLIKVLELADKDVPAPILADLLHFCEGNPADIVTPNQMFHHYWVVISSDITLDKMGIPFSSVRPGTLIGGKSWDLADDRNDSRNSWNLSMAKETVDAGQTFLIGVIPENKLPWFVNSSPADEEFDKNYLPVIQWLMTQHLSHLILLEQMRDLLFDRYARISEVVVTEKKVREFEGNKSIVSEENYRKIQILVMENLGMKMGKNPKVSSEVLSKQIYNWILEQTKRDFPNLKIEEQGNKAYTLWRFIQSQIIKDVYIKGSSAEIKLDSPPSVFQLIGMEFEKSLKKMAVKKNEAGFDMLSSPPEINLAIIFQGADLVTGKKLELALIMLETLEKFVILTADEGSEYQKQLNAISTVKTEFDIQEVKEQFISESIKKLQKTLYEKMEPA